METKQEFTDGLRRALTGKISASRIEEHIRYYEDYITSEGRIKGSEKDVLDALGDPKLIAMSICAAEAAGERGGNSQTEGYGYGECGTGAEEERRSENGTSFLAKHPKMVIAIVIGVIVLVAVLFLLLAFSLLKILWPVLLGIIAIVFLVRLIRLLRDR